MENDLQQQFVNAFSKIPFEEGKTLLEAEIIYGCLVNEDFVKITLILPTDSPYRKTLPPQIEAQVKQIEGIRRVVVESLSEPPPEEEEAPAKSAQRPVQQPKRASYLQNYEVVIAVASGKGGVGKSTISLNLALALAQMGHQVALFDADIYGPSLPIMSGMREAKPEVLNNRLQPLEAYGLHMMSIGNLVDETASMVWRGPMVHQAIEQLLRDTQWPGGDFMIMDLPPGTGDVQLTLSQLCEITGAVIVSTPQDVALLDAVKAVNMFSKVDIEIIGIVENMHTFICPHCQKETAIFNTNGAERTSQELKVPFLGHVPLDLSIREGGDAGTPIMSQKIESPAIEAFKTIAVNVMKSLEALE